MALRVIFIKGARKISCKNSIQRKKGTKFNFGMFFILSTCEGTWRNIYTDKSYLYVIFLSITSAQDAPKLPALQIRNMYTYMYL